MSAPESKDNPTGDWRKYPKGPNFLGIVLGACAVLLVLFVVVYFVLGWDARKLMPHPANPHPNSSIKMMEPLNGQGSAQG